MNIIIKKIDELNDEILDFLTDESFILFCKIKLINETDSKILKYLKDELRKIYTNESSDTNIYIAILNDELIGIARIDNNNHISDLFVKKDYQNKGIGTLLLKKVIDDNKQKGSITLNANKEYIDFYLKNDFKIVSELKDSIMMKK